jgi:hypothetical protein
MASSESIVRSAMMAKLALRLQIRLCIMARKPGGLVVVVVCVYGGKVGTHGC